MNLNIPLRMNPDLWGELPWELVKMILVFSIPSGVAFTNPHLKPRRQPRCKRHQCTPLSDGDTKWSIDALMVSKRFTTMGLRKLWGNNQIVLMDGELRAHGTMVEVQKWLEEEVMTYDFKGELIYQARGSLMRHLAFEQQRDEPLVPLDENWAHEVFWEYAPPLSDKVIRYLSTNLEHELDTLVMTFSDCKAYALTQMHDIVDVYWFSETPDPSPKDIQYPDMVWKRGEEDIGGASWTLTIPDEPWELGREQAESQWWNSFHFFNWPMGFLRAKKLVLKAYDVETSSHFMEQRLKARFDMFNRGRCRTVFEGDNYWMDEEERLGERKSPDDLFKIIPLESFIQE